MNITVLDSDGLEIHVTYSFHRLFVLRFTCFFRVLGRRVVCGHESEHVGLRIGSKTRELYLDAFACEAILSRNRLLKLLHAADMRRDKPPLGVDSKLKTRLLYRHLASSIVINLAAD